MNITVFGAGNQDLYVNKLDLPNKYGGEAPYGGSRMAIEFARGGHSVVLVEPNRNMLTEEQWKIVEDAGVTVISDDKKGASHGEIAIFFTPFGNKTVEIVKNIINYLPENAVICNTCTISPVSLYISLEVSLRTKRKDVGISSMHPAAVPGTPQHEHYVISGKSINGEQYATEEQINKCVELVESIGKKPYVVNSEISGLVSDMGSMVSAVTLAGILDYYTVGKEIINAPEEMIEQQIAISLQTIASIIETSGVKGLLNAIDLELLIKSASSMKLLEQQKELDSSLEILKELDEKLIKEGKKTPLKHTNIVSSQLLVKELENIVGKSAANGMIKRSTKKIFTIKKE